jgi:hypothetical protein
MESRKPFNQRNSSNNKYDRFVPQTAVGKLLFFDYNRNKFGIISNVRYSNNTTIEKVHVSEEGLASRWNIKDGETVSLTLNKGYKGYFATNVKPFREIDLASITDFVELIGINELEDIIYNSVKNNYQDLSHENKEQINKVILRINSVEAWSLLIKIGAENNQIDLYITNFIDKQSDEEKVEFLKSSFSIALLKNIMSKWSTNKKNPILELIQVISYKEFPVDLVTENIITIISELEWTFHQIYRIFSVLRSDKIAQLVLNNFSFLQYDSLEILKTLLPLEQINNEKIEILKANLISQIDSIKAPTILNIFSELKEYRLIKDDNELLELLREKTMRSKEIESLVLSLSEKFKPELLRHVINYNYSILSSSSVIEIIKELQERVEIAKVLIEEYYSIDEENLSSHYTKILEYLKVRNEKELTFHFVDKFYKLLNLRYPKSIIELAIQSKHTKAQKYVYQYIKFTSESETVDFISNEFILELSNQVKSINKPLTAYLSYYMSESEFDINEDCKIFLENNKGVVQSLLVKFLVFQLYKKNISKLRLIEILNSVQWTDINALLIKSFIQQANYTEKILLDKLNQIFKTHFEVLTTQNIDPKSFLDNFSIRNILNTCDGRKNYNAEYWHKNGISRWYVNGDVSIYIKETMDCYCEGRPWKKEKLWDSKTNRPLSKSYEFYWCRNNYCTARNDLVDMNKVYHEWTLSEIAEAINVKIEKIALATLAGWANRMNQIIEHLFCRTCNEVLRPLPFKPRTLGYYAVPLFHCINDKCPDKQIIRFTHCLNSKCVSHEQSEPLDSRDCESCKPSDPNHTGLKCNFCGSSCPACSGYSNKITAQEMW